MKLLNVIVSYGHITTIYVDGNAHKQPSFCFSDYSFTMNKYTFVSMCVCRFCPLHILPRSTLQRPMSLYCSASGWKMIR